jgi:hypothetical protein
LIRLLLREASDRGRFALGGSIGVNAMILPKGRIWVVELFSAISGVPVLLTSESMFDAPTTTWWRTAAGYIFVDRSEDMQWH